MKDPAHRDATNQEKTINNLWYRYLSEKEVATALVLFRLNATAYPKSANAYDSLGDGYEAADDERDALDAYKKSVQLNPNNEHAKREIVRLESSR